MKFVKWFLLILILILSVFSAITLFLPTEYSVERSIEIAAPELVVYAQVSDLEIWQEWNPWNELDPQIQINYGEVTSGIGASYDWISEVTGNGNMTIVEARPPEYVRFQMEFEGYENLPSFSEFIIEGSEDGKAANVTWTFEGSVGDRFFARWMTVIMDKVVGASYEKGLESLKTRCEQAIEG